MSENEDSGYESPASDHDEEELIILEKTLKRRWGDNSFEKSQSSSTGRSSEQVPEHEIAFRQILMLREKIKSTSPGKWRRLVPGYNLVLQRILKLAEFAPNETLIFLCYRKRNLEAQKEKAP
ncbi:unnamed protein product [Arctia plantaginis]|uniref:Uncharacterized protein n=1 Tax=Arctia plantaginis TaxID=874455 RepID=A0A8S1AY83_ARCPL|nr:unnamed protein product [Arctia plantaginis]CAB3253729.1 unnamed protein product [Arctia plantaginis]